MPVKALHNLAKKRHISIEHAEELWDKAKKIVSNEYGSKDDVKGYWALVMGITKKMMGIKPKYCEKWRGFRPSKLAIIMPNDH